MSPGLIIIAFLVVAMSVLFLKEKNNRVSLTIGFILCLALNSLMQDFVGKEEVLRSMAANWVDSYKTGPAAVFVLIWCLYVLSGIRSAEKQD